jgi:hypothetical protein
MSSLSNQFNSILSKYITTYKSYLDSSDNSLTIVPDSLFTGQTNLSVLTNSTLNDCHTSCLSNNACTGATFDSKLQTCILNSGNGDLIYKPHSTAIVQQKIFYNKKLHELNEQLLQINKQINKQIISSNSSIPDTSHSGSILQSEYQLLLKEREKITERINQHQTLDSKYQHGSLIVSSNYYTYIFLVLFVIFLIIILLRYN